MLTHAFFISAIGKEMSEIRYLCRHGKLSGNISTRTKHLEPGK